MGSIAIPPVSQWNIRAAENVSCWACEHFQRYDSGANPTDCAGECRKDSPWGANGYTVELITPVDWAFDGFFPCVPNGNVSWCNGFQRSLETDIPPSPGDESSDCSHTDPTTWTRPDNVRDANMFTKKPVTETSRQAGNLRHGGRYPTTSR